MRLRPGYDIVVPSFVDDFARSRLLEGNLPYFGRPVLMAYYGGGPGWSEDGSYGEVLNHREQLAKLASLPRQGTSIGGYQDDYEWLLGQARFCLVPKGLGYWTHRLYEAILAGCIPVILSDRVVLPFHGLDWAKFSIKWPEDCLGEDLYDWLAAVGRRKGAQMKAELDKVSCWFDYHADGACNAVAAALAALGQAPGLQRPFWNAPRSSWLRPDHNCTAQSFDMEDWGL